MFLPSRPRPWCTHLFSRLLKSPLNCLPSDNPIQLWRTQSTPPQINIPTIIPWEPNKLIVRVSSYTLVLCLLIIIPKGLQFTDWSVWINFLVHSPPSLARTLPTLSNAIPSNGIIITPTTLSFASSSPHLIIQWGRTSIGLYCPRRPRALSPPLPFSNGISSWHLYGPSPLLLLSLLDVRRGIKLSRKWSNN